MSSIDCLKILFEQTRLVNPSWAEINNFVHFLNEQLYILERSKITSNAFVYYLSYLIGYKLCVFYFQMSRRN